VTDSREAEWLQRRRSVIGGSDVAPVMGMSRFRSPWDVYMDKTGQSQDSGPDGSVKDRGRYLEPGVAKWFADARGMTIVPRDQYEVIIGPEPWMGASVDAFVEDASGRHGLEVKTARSSKGWGESGSDVIPVDYMLQVQWYMAVCGHDHWFSAVYFNVSDEFRWYRIARSDAALAKIVPYCRAWWEKHVVNGIAPPIDGSDGASAWIAGTFPSAEEDERPGTPGEQDMAMELERIKVKKREIEKKEKELRNRIAASIGKSRGIYFRESGNSVQYREESRRSIDEKALKQKYPEIANELTVTTSYRKLVPVIKENV
jgi:putative phage-type endonuclease